MKRTEKPVKDGITRAVLQNPLVVVLIVMIVVVQVFAGSFLTTGNLRGLALDSSVIAIVSVFVAMLVICGYIDLSVGATVGLGGVVAAKVLIEHDGSAVVAVLAAVVAGALVGTVNGFVSCYLGLASFVTTLGMLTAVRGLAQLLSPLPLSGFSEGFTFLGLGAVAGIPVPVLIAAVALIAAAVFLTSTAAGRHVYAIGVNSSAAFLSGINIRKTPFLLFVCTGAAAGLGGAIVASRLNSAPAGQLGLGFELVVLTAVLLGGVALSGGEGNMLGVLVGVLFLGVLSNGLTLFQVTQFWQNIASGAALILAIGIAKGTTTLRHRLDRAPAPPAPADQAKAAAPA